MKLIERNRTIYDVDPDEIEETVRGLLREPPPPAPLREARRAVYGDQPGARRVWTGEHAPTRVRVPG